ncbi:MAG: hypothetical protein COA94_07160 [Rickettsiales bacterium]|nr:MAG: hypothetical protein COA94_07160 [Rickettsiales bacterium]
MDITSSVEISRFFMYNGLLHSLGVDGKLYALSVPIEHNYWEWEEQLWCVNEIDHVSVTLDEHNIWIQRKYVHISGTRGYLYEGNSLISTHSLNVNVIRNYGITTLEYVEINKKTMVMYATPSGVILNNVSNARIGFDSKIVHSGGELIKVIFDRMVKVSIETYTTY